MQIKEYIDYIGCVRRYSPRTRELYEEILTEFQNNGEQLTPTGIRNYEIHLLDEKKENARTVGLHLSVLSGYCKYLIKKGDSSRKENCHPTPYALSNVRRSRNGCRSFTGRTR